MKVEKLVKSYSGDLPHFPDKKKNRYCTANRYSSVFEGGNVMDRYSWSVNADECYKLRSDIENIIVFFVINSYCLPWINIGS